ncbi:hypothetical protein [Euzebya tangerina]|uniref:hypothetical protein n=1 Tax=Euzebya tangerina TaxID=591198 RepID=UPI000E3117B6|nr:hypothetical protein [Euzebya tangerina]
MDSSSHPGSSHPGTAVTTFDQHTAEAVVVVLERAGIRAWTTDPAPDGDVEVMVEEGQREAALRTLAQRMDEVRDASAALRPEPARPESVKAPRFRRRSEDEDDDQSALPEELRDGPPLVMERFRNLSWVLVILLVPLMVVTLAPTIRSDLGIRIALGVAVVVIVTMVVRRRR